MPSRSYLQALLRAVILGLFSGAFGLVYLFVVEGGIHLAWGDWESVEWFSGELQVLLIPIVAGLIVGLVYLSMNIPPRFKGFIDELEDGHVEPKTVPGAALVSVISLIGGASLGPEAPLGTVAGGAGTWMAKRAGGDEQEVRTSTFVGMSGAFGGLLSTPLGGPLLAFELEHEQSPRYYFTHLIPGVVAGAVAFGVMWPVIGAPFIGLYDLEPPPFESWMLLAGVGLGMAGGMAALIVGRILTMAVALMRPLDNRPIVRGLLGGMVVGAVGFTLPLTLFSGTEGLVPITQDPAAIGLGVLLALALLKTIAVAASLGGGFYGGVIFPTFFIGGALGAAAHLIFPAIPLALAIGAMMAALGSALAMIPLTMTVLAALLTQSGFIGTAAILIAAVTAYAIRYSLTEAGAQSDAAVASAASIGD